MTSDQQSRSGDKVMATDAETVRDLRRRWKPHKARLNALHNDHPTTVRFHRACSWLEQTEQAAGEQHSDLVLIQQWIAFNALYGQWNAQAQEPAADLACWKAFLKRLLALDESQHVANVLLEHKRLVMAILENAYLNPYFWDEPTTQAHGRYSKKAFRAQSWYVEKRWLMIAEDLLERIYLLRCQIVHGAATCGSRLNRTALKHCTTMMRLLLTAMLNVWIDYGADEDWGALCYPPVELGAVVNATRPRTIEEQTK